MKVRQLMKMCEEFGLGLDDEIVLWTWNGHMSRHQWLNLTANAFNHKGYVVLMTEPYADDIKFTDDKRIGCSGCGKWMKVGDKYGTSIDCIGISWTGCEECCKKNNVITDKEVTK